MHSERVTLKFKYLLTENRYVDILGENLFKYEVRKMHDESACDEIFCSLLIFRKNTSRV